MVYVVDPLGDDAHADARDAHDAPLAASLDAAMGKAPPGSGVIVSGVGVGGGGGDKPSPRAPASGGAASVKSGSGASSANVSAPASRPGTASSTAAPPPTTAAPSSTGAPAATAAPGTLFDALGRRLRTVDAGGRAVAGGWRGLRSDGGAAVPSVAAMQALLSRGVGWRAARSGQADTVPAGGGVLFSCHGRSLASLPPAALAALPLTAARFAVLLDNVTNAASLRRLAEEATAKRAVEGRMEAEGAWETAALLSLCGVGTVVLHQWASTHAANQALLYTLVSDAAAVSSSPDRPSDLLLADLPRRTWAPPPDAPAAAAGAAAGPAAGGSGAVPPVPTAASDDGSAPPPPAVRHVRDRVRWNTVAYGLPTTALLPALP